MKPFIKRETIYDPEKLQKTKEFLQKVKPDLTDSQFADIIEMEKKAIIYSNDVYQVNIYNAVGEIVGCEVINNESQKLINLRNISAGVYFV